MSRWISRAKRSTKAAIDLIDGTTFRARPVPAPEGAVSAFYEQHGYAIFRGVISLPKIDALRATLETEVISADGASLRYQTAVLEPNRFVAGTPGKRVLANALLDPHAQPETPRTAAAIEALLLTEAIADLLASIDGADNHTV